MPHTPTTLEAIADELYAGPPASFVAARDAQVKRARGDGDKELAAAVKALRRPATAAWLVNLLAHADDGLAELTDLADRLRGAQARLDGAAMKELGADRNRVVAELTRRAVALGTDADPSYRGSAPVREQISATLSAAVADPAAEAAVHTGRLVSALSYAGFGEVDLTDAVATPLRSVPRPDEEPAAAAKPDGRDEAADQRSEPSAKTPETPEEPAIDPAKVKRAEQALAAAEKRLAVTEEAYAQARSRRHHARLEVERLRLELEELQDD